MRSEKVTDIKQATLSARIQPAECVKHGAFEQKVTLAFGKEFASHCPECTRLAKEEQAAADEAKRAYERRVRTAEKLGEALIPKRFAKRTLENYAAETEGQKRALSFCRHYVKTFDAIRETGRCMVLIGKPGTGKTHLGAAIANELLHKTSRTAVYRTVGSILQAIRSTYDRNSERNEADILSSLIEPDLLVLDEVGVGKEQPSDFELTTLFSIINGRYEQELPTIVISNLDAAELPKAMGERCVDRLREGNLIVVPFNWDSHRAKEGI